MRKRAVNHFLFWFLYLAFEIYTEFEWILSAYQFSVPQALQVAITGESLLVFAIKIPMVYLIFRMFDEFSFKKNDKIKLILSSSLILFIFSVLSRTLTVAVLYPKVYQLETPKHFLEFQGLINSFMDIIFIAGITIALKQHSVSNRLIKREKVLQKEKLETELNFLKAQINPHFLFNTLNSIYALSRRKSEQTAEVVLKLSKLLRFVLYEAQVRTITIGKEIQFLSDYIELEKIRYDHRLKVGFNHQTDDETAHIVPLTLVPFVENAFKHGASETTSAAFITIDLKLHRGKFLFTVENSFEYEVDVGRQEGIGLKNLRRQLELVYPDFDLRTEISDQSFKATLTLDLNRQA